MFEIVSTHRFWWPVKVRVPSQIRAGLHELQEFEVQFEVLSPEAASAMDQAADEAGRDQAEHAIDIILRIVKDWKGVHMDGRAVDFSEALLREACRQVYVRRALFDAYAEAISGGGAKRKN